MMMMMMMVRPWSFHKYCYGEHMAWLRTEELGETWLRRRKPTKGCSAKWWWWWWWWWWGHGCFISTAMGSTWLLLLFSQKQSFKEYRWSRPRSLNDTLKLHVEEWCILFSYVPFTWTMYGDREKMSNTGGQCIGTDRNFTVVQKSVNRIVKCALK